MISGSTRQLRGGSGAAGQLTMGPRPAGCTDVFVPASGSKAHAFLKIKIKGPLLVTVRLEGYYMDRFPVHGGNRNA